MNRHTIVGIVIVASAAALGACDRPAEEAPPPATTAPETTAPETAQPPASAPPSTPGATAGGVIEAPGLALSIPRGWTQQPAGSMRLAELRAPAPEGSAADSALAAFFNFGPQGAGPADANLARWASMVTAADGGASEPRKSSETSDGLTLHLIEVDGTYLDGPPGGQKTARENYALFGAVIEGGAQPLYVRMTGPRDVMEAQRGAWLGMIRSVRVVSE